MSTETSSGRLFGNKYLVIDELGRGGMGAVYTAKDTKLQRQVALKHLILDSGLDKEAKEEVIYNFKREAIALANINHSNIVNVYDLGQEDENNHYIVMELIDGQPLSKLLKDQPLMPEQVINIASQICDALDYVHNNKVIHRDIKPDNIIFTSKGVCKLTDFGIAKSENTRSYSFYSQGSIVGTILYISPEQLQNPDGVDGNADQYSFAVTLYEMLTGSTPFNSENPRDVIMKILGEDPIPPSRIIPAIPKKLDDVILKAMAKNPEERYPGTAAFAEALRNAVLNSGKPEIDPEVIAAERQRAHEDLMKSVNLDWLDKLDTLMEDDKDDTQKDFFFLDSLAYIVPRIPTLDINNLLASLSSASDPANIINFLSIFDGVKTLKDIIQESGIGNIFDKIIESAEKDLIDKRAIEIVKNLKQVIGCSVPLRAFVLMLKNSSSPADLIKFLLTFDGKKTMKEIIEQHYSMEQSYLLFNFLYDCHQQGIIEITAFNFPDNDHILLGDILVTFALITKGQLNLVLKEGKAPDIMIGENLIAMGFISKDKVVNSLKIQQWYKGLFSH